MRLLISIMLLLITCPVLYAQIQHSQINNSSTNIVFSGSKLTTYTEVEIQVNTAKGASYGEISIPYTKGNNIKELEAGIYDLLGNKIRSLKKKDIVKSNAFSYAQFHSDDMILSFEFIHNRYPYIIKYQYSEDVNNFINIAHWVPGRYKKAIVKNATLTLETPSNCELYIHQQSIDSAKIENVNNKTIYTWTAKDLTYPKREKYAPPIYELFPKVIITPKEFKYGIKGSTNTWSDFGNWNYQLIANLDNLSESEKEKIHSLTKDCKTQKEKVNILYKYLQDNTRYINVSLKIGGLLPKSAYYVCNNKYGDCKALSNYMLTMLKEVGIHSAYTTVYADRNPVKIDIERPAQQFNHVILCVPLDNDTVWLECTDNTAPFNYLGTFTQGRTVLLNDGENSRITQTPTLSAQDVINTFTTKVEIDANSRITLKSNGTVRGRSFDYLKSLDDGLPERNKIEYLEDMELFENSDIQSYSIEREHRDSTFINLHLEANANNVVEPIGGRILIKPLKPFYFKLEKPSNRTQELRFNYPHNECDSIIYQLPRNIKSISGIKTTSFRSDYGEYNRTVTIDESQLTVTRHIIIKRGFYDVDEYAEVYEFIRKCNNQELQKAIITYQ